jgi:hypothetical protein
MLIMLALVERGWTVASQIRHKNHQNLNGVNPSIETGVAPR